jgi:hypothetical protein
MPSVRLVFDFMPLQTDPAKQPPQLQPTEDPERLVIIVGALHTQLRAVELLFEFIEKVRVCHDKGDI